MDTDTLSETQPAPKVEAVKLSPFMKCLGGKTKMLGSLLSHFPKDFADAEYTYCEAFLGGGSLLLSLLSSNPDLKAYVNDFNYDTFNLWAQVGNRPEELMTLTEEHRQNNSKEYFLQVRAGLSPSTIGLDVDTREALIRASDFLYLNKTAFNGLVRYNSKGEFNSPYGSYVKPCIYERSNIIGASKALTNVSLSNLDFDKFIDWVLSEATGNILVYLDPPYIPLTPTANFTSYTSKGFNLGDHHRLRAALDKLNAKGIKFMLSNSKTSLTEEIFKGYNFHDTTGLRSINCVGKKRGPVGEYIITNY